MGKAKKPIDWPSVERDYRKTKLPVRELARWYDCDEKSIRLRARAEGWTRPGQSDPQPAPQAPQPLAAVVAPVVERIRPDLGTEPARTGDLVERGRRVALCMLDELEATTSHLGELAEEIEAAAPGSDNARRREGMLKAISLPTRSGILKNLAQSVKTLAEANAPAGKKAAAAEDAKTAGFGSDWGDDLAIPSARPN